MRYFILAVVAFFIAACSGYKPAPEYSVDIFEEPVLIKVKIDPEDPDIGVYLEDEVARMAIDRLNLTTTKSVTKAKNYILVNRYTINTSPVNKDENGSIIRYSVNSAIEFAIKDKYGFWSKNIVSSAYVTVEPQSLVSSFHKDKAAKMAIGKALDEFILSTISRSRKVGTHKNEIPDSNSSLEDTTIEDINSTIIDKVSIKEEPNPFTENSSEEINVNIVPVDSDTMLEDATSYN